MADLSHGALDALVRLMNGDVDLDSLSSDELLLVADALKPETARHTLSQALRLVNDRGMPFATIGERLGVHETTAMRWSNPAPEDRRRRPRRPGATS